jgi:uncharacterized membrane protein
MPSALKALPRDLRTNHRMVDAALGAEMGGLTILLATTAMIWNIIYNALFDRLCRRTW